MNRIGCKHFLVGFATIIVLGSGGRVEAQIRQQGPSNRTHELIVSEIMYHPRTSDTNDVLQLEYIEIFNACPVELDLRGFRISGDVDFTFPTNDSLVKDNSIKIGGHSYLIVAANKSRFQAVYGKPADYEWNPAAGNNLPNDSGTVRLRNRRGDILYEVKYQDDNPWPKLADGRGHSLVLARPDLGEANPAAWDASFAGGGSPKALDLPLTDGLAGVVINELQATSQGVVVELYNAGNAVADLSNCELLNGSWDEATPQRYALSGSLAPGQFIQINPNSAGFDLPVEGDELYLAEENSLRMIDFVEYRALKLNEAYGRLPDGGDRWGSLATASMGSTNNGQNWLREDVLLTEIMFNSPHGSDSEFLELYNRGNQTLDLSDWHIRGDVSYTIPAGTQLGAGDYLVIAKDEKMLLSAYAGLTASDVVGNYSGNLSNSRGLLRVLEPAYTNSANQAVSYRLVDEVSFKDFWGEWTDGGGSSLELLDVESDNGLAVNWVGSDETQKASWTTVEVVNATNFYGKAEYGMNNGRTRMPSPYEAEVHLMLQDRGECLVDNVEVELNGGGNLLSSTASQFNYSFPSSGPEYGTGITRDSNLLVTSQFYWQIKGTHRDSRIVDQGGFGDNGRCLHMVARDEGNTGPNHVEHELQNKDYFDKLGTDFAEGAGGGVQKGETIRRNANRKEITLRAKARWMAGTDLFMIRLNAGYMECVGKLPIPTNLGSPGAVNSRNETNAGPSICENKNTPLLPSRGDDCVITARVQDPQGVKTVTLFTVADTNAKYDYAPSAYTQLAMKDDGTNGDAVAHDGIYSAILPQPPASNKHTSNNTHNNGKWNEPDKPDRNGLVRYYIQAEDQSGAIREYPENHSNNRDALVLFDGIARPGAFNNLRMLITAWSMADFDGGYGAPDEIRYGRESDQRFAEQSNAEAQCTLIYNDARVIHGATFRYRGSAYKRPRAFDDKLFSNISDSFKVRVREGEKLLNARTFNYDALEFYEGANTANDPGLQRERNAFWIADQLGMPTLRPQYTTIMVNSARKGQVHTDVQKMNSNYLKARYPEDPDGDLHTCLDWFSYGEKKNLVDYNTKLRMNAKIGDQLRYYKHKDGVLWHDLALDYNVGNFRWQWVKKSGDINNYDNLMEFLSEINGSDFVAAAKKYINVENFMQYIAFRLMMADLDGFLMQHGKNGFVYKPEHGKWEVLLWDLDHAMGSGGDLTNDAWPSNADLFPPVICKEDNINLSKRWYDNFTTKAVNSHGELRRAALRTYWRALNGPLKTGNWDYVFDQYKAAFDANGIYAEDKNHSGGLNVRASIASFTSTQRNRISSYFNNASYWQPNLTFEITDHKIQYGIVTVMGTAPIDVASIWVNGYEIPIDFIDDYTWQMRIVLQPGMNNLTLQAYDLDGKPISGMSDQLSGLDPAQGAGASQPILHYDFEGSGIDLLDQSGNGFHGEMRGATGRTTQGAAVGNQCLELPGNTGDYAAVPSQYESNFDMTMSDSFSGSVWLKVREWTTDAEHYTAGVFAKSDGSSWKLTRESSKDNLRFLLHGTSTPGQVKTPSLATNTWYHIVFVHDGVALENRMYLNGTLVDSQPCSGNISLTDKMVTIGGIDRTDQKRVIPGWMDEVQFFTNALDQMEVNNLYAGRNADDFGPAGIPAALPGALAGKLRISEVMYHAVDDATYPEFSASDYEYVELYNAANHGITLTGAQFSKGIDFSFGDDFLGAGKYAVVVANEEAFRTRYGAQARILGQYVGSLSNGGEKLMITDVHTNEVFQLDYNDKQPWPTPPDGTGPSLGLVSLSGSGTNATEWASEISNGTPGLPFQAPQNFPEIYISEIMTHTDHPQMDAIELHNPNGFAVDLSGWTLSDAKDNPTAYAFPSGSILSAGGYLVVQEDNDGNTNSVPNSTYFGAAFRLSSHGETCYLFASTNNGPTYLMDEVKFTPSANGVSFGRKKVSTGAVYYPAQLSTTLGTAYPSSSQAIHVGASNAGPKVGPLVITEILPVPAVGYHEFVEIKNISASSVNLYDDSTGPKANSANTYEVEGINFSFPAGLSIAPGETILLVSDTTTESAFRTANGLGSTPRIYLFTGDLSNNGERLAIVYPDAEDTNPVTGKTIIPKIIMDEVRYETAAPWPGITSGYSLQRKQDTDYGNEPNNWLASAAIGGDPSGNGGTNPFPNGDPNKDTDGDGVNDFLETAFKTNPAVKDKRAFYVRNSAGDIEFTVRNLKTGFTYTVQTNSTLLNAGSWGTYQTLNGNSIGQPTTLTIPTPQGSSDQLFIRLEVSD